VGIPTSHLIVQQYLERFSERMSMQWWHYALPVISVFFILFLVVVSTLRKAAKSNPVDALKHE